MAGATAGATSDPRSEEGMTAADEVEALLFCGRCAFPSAPAAFTPALD